jgi:hypothetical protein
MPASFPASIGLIVLMGLGLSTNAAAQDLNLGASPMITGEAGAFTVDGAGAALGEGTPVWFMKGAEEGAGGCPGYLEGQCWGITSPRFIRVTWADGGGIATWDLSVDGDVGTTGAFQAAVDGPGGVRLSNPVVVTIEPEGGGVAPNPECTAYTVLDQDFRHVSQTGAINCDSGLSYPAWYRFEGPAGTKMPDYSPGELQCSTHAPGWFDGVHPLGLGETSDFRLCWQWAGSTCFWENSDQVTNCGEYYVYNLTGIFGCSGIHCGDEIL